MKIMGKSLLVFKKRQGEVYFIDFFTGYVFFLSILPR